MVQSSLAGGGPLNVMVLYNESSTDSEAVANAYQQARMLPFGHTCPVSGLATTEREISFESYTQTIGAAVETCLSTLPHPNEIDYLVLARGLPYRITLETGFTTSVSAMLQMHHATTSDNAPIAGSAHAQSNGLYHASVKNPAYVGYDNYSCELEVTNTAQGWYTAACDILKSGELPLSFARDSVSNGFGNDYENNLFIVTRLDGFNYEDALDLIERGVAADSSYPTEALLCMEGADSARAARDPECELVARHLALAGFNSSYLSPHDANLSGAI